MNKINLSIIALSTIFTSNLYANKLPTPDFLKRGGQHCTGYCEPATIKCYPSIMKQGYYDWCKKNCLHKNKKGRENFVQGIAFCEKQFR